LPTSGYSLSGGTDHDVKSGSDGDPAVSGKTAEMVRGSLGRSPHLPVLAG
jgi:hypothetical protein